MSKFIFFALIKGKCAYLTLFGISLLHFSCSYNEADLREKKPNIIIIMTDDQGYGHIGAHGNPHLKTPNLDQLYQESVRFTDFHVDPSCSPTRASILTGKYSSKSGVWHTIGGRSLLQKDMLTIGDVFKSAGYKTGYFGKWHLGENYPYRPMDRGFEETIVHGGGASSIHPDYWGNDYFDDVYKHNGEYKKYEGYSNTVWFDEALNFIENNQDKPFFTYLSTNIPHAPLLVEENYSLPYKSIVSERIANYYGMLAKFDEDLGHFLQEIERLKLKENTIVIFMSDNGPCPWFGGLILDDDLFVKEGYNYGMRGAKIRGYEGAHRVPFFIRWPMGGIGGGKDVDKLAAHIDLFPTLIDLAGLEKPSEHKFDGTSLRKLMENPSAEWNERTLFVHNQRLQYPEKYKDYQVLTEKWRLEGRENAELYEIDADPGQQLNVKDQYPEVVKQLTKEYEAWWEDISTNFDHYNNIIIGNVNENPSIIYAHDALRSEDGMVWAIDVEQEGIYEFSTYRWPIESGRKIVENEGAGFRHNLLPTSTMNSDRFAMESPNTKTSEVLNKAHLTIGNLEREIEITNSMTAANFMVHLIPGQTSLKAWFSGNEKSAANYIKVQFVGPGVLKDNLNYKPVHPDSFLRPYLMK
jgi:arylsulfatase A-like enzyme